MSYKTLPLLRKMSNNNSNWKANAILGKMKKHRNDSFGNDSYTKLLLHMDGVDNGTTFTDDSASNHIITRHNALTKTSVKKFGTASGYFDGYGDYLTIPDSDDWHFGTGDFTIDFWVFPNSIVNNSCILAHINWGTTILAFSVYINGTTLEFYASSNGSTWELEQFSLGTLNTGSWQHFALTRSGDFFKGYKNGVQISNVENSTNIVNISELLYIGTNPSHAYFNGYIDELRISKGIARWTENFTPPTQPYS